MHMRRMRVVVQLSVVILSLASIDACAQPAAVRIPGTYSNLAMNEDGGDLLGVEIKIVPIGERYQGAVFLSEGEPQPMTIVEVRVRGTSVEFDVPGKQKTGWKFSGQITGKSLTGTIRYASGGVEKVVLPRRCGYWDH